MRPAKQKRLGALRDIANEAAISEAALSRVLAKIQRAPSLLEDIGNAAASTLRKDFTKAAQRTLETLGSKVELPQVNGTVRTLTAASPQSILMHFVETQPAVKELMQVKLRDHQQPWRMVLYHDEVTPGNVLRPDNKRKICAIYASFLEFGSCLIRDELLWMPLAIVKHDLAVTSVGGLSGIILIIFRKFFGNGKIDEGTLLKLDPPMIFRFTVSNVLADEAALKATWNCKGASGIKPCVLCKNVVMKGVLVAPQAYLVEIDDHKSEKFDSMSNDEWFSLADHLAQQRAIVNKTKLEQLEKCAGLNYNVAGLMYDQEMRQIIKPMTSTFDSMHVWFNNGIANGEVHAFLEAAKEKCGLTYEMISTYIEATDWHAPSFQSNIAARVFSEQKNKSNKDSFKAMSQELLAALPFLRQLVSTTLATRPEIRQEVQSFLAACACVDLLQQLKYSTAPSEEMCTALLRATEHHLELHKACYGSQHVRPKHHYGMHLPSQIRRDGILLDAFTLERKHRNAKRIATTVSVANLFEESVLARLLQEQLESIPDSFIRNQLVGTTAQCQEVASAIGEPECRLAQRARCQGLCLSVQDVLLASGSALQVLAFVPLESGISAIVEVFEFSEKWGFATRWRPQAHVALFCFDSCFTVAQYWCKEGAMLLTL